MANPDTEPHGSGKPTCGAATRDCSKRGCGHHQQLHRDGPCAARGCRCQGFVGKPCKDDRLFPNGRCRRHGGLTPSGVNSPQFVHGLRSAAIPNDLQARYHEILADPNLEDLKHDLATVELYLQEVMGKKKPGQPLPLRWHQRFLELSELKRADLVAMAKREQYLGTSLTVEQAQALFGALRAAVTRHVTDPAALRRIQADFQMLTGRRRAAIDVKAGA